MSNRQVHVDKVVVEEPKSAAALPKKKKEEPVVVPKKSGGRDAAFYALMMDHDHLIPSNAVKMSAEDQQKAHDAKFNKAKNDDDYEWEYY